jgi:hypothetical protein
MPQMGPEKSVHVKDDELKLIEGSKEGSSRIDEKELDAIGGIGEEEGKEW